MPVICPVCTKQCFNSQNQIQCSSCHCYVHHGNRLNCSGLTDAEFQLHVGDQFKPYDCDHCISERNSRNNRYNLTCLPFTHESDINIFNAPTINQRPDVKSLSPEELRKFVSQCKSIQEHINLQSDVVEDDFFSTQVNSKYYDLKQFNKLKPDISSSLSLMHVNIASLNLHIDDLKTVLARLNTNFDIIGISEHKIRSGTTPSNNIEISGYREFEFEPTGTTHGGVGFYIKNNLDYFIRPDLILNSPSNFETMFVEIVLPDRKNLVVGCVYRHPSSDVSVKEFSENYLEPILHKINREKKVCAIMGDFNIDLLKSTGTSESNDFYNNLSSYFFTPFILQPTRLASKTLIDNILVNSLEYHSISGNILLELSDHLMQFVILEGFTKERCVPENNMKKRDLSKFSEKEFEELVINNTNWDEICMMNYQDPSVSFGSFYNKINYHLDEMAPLKKLTLKEFRLKLKPWITKEILTKCDQRDLVLKNIKSETDPNKLESLRKDYKLIRNEITQEKRKSKKAHFTTYFAENKKKSSDIWKGIKSIVNIKPSKSSSIKLMDDNKNLISDPLKIANIFNDHFSTLGKKVQEKIPSDSSGSFTDYMNKKDENGKLFINPDGCSFFLSPTVPDEISKIIDALDLKKSEGPNGIPVFLLKIFKQFFSLWLSKLVNLCFETGIFPDLLKLAKVQPLHKKESKLNYLNYRPISILSVFSKIYEKLMYTRIYSYLDKNNLIYSKQFGFRSKYSTNHAIISLTEHIRNLIDNGQYVCGIFVDLEKAFDTVHHNLLCDKLEYYGLRGNINKLIKSYLTDRKQYVSLSGFDSEIKNITCGVPQGSSLGPLLFLIYINDFRLCLDKTSSGHFADDTFLIFNSKNPKTIETVMNYELKLMTKWLRLNKLSLNAAKTELIFFHSQKHKLNYDDITIKLNRRIKLKPVDYVKYLGMLIDKYLSWNFHVNELCKKLARANGILSKLRYNAPLENCIQVYYAIFYSHLSYGCNVWGLGNSDNIDKVEVLQKKCIRIISFAPHNSHTNQLFQALKLLKVRDVIKINQLKLIYDFYDNSLPTDLMNLFKSCTNVHTTNMQLNSSIKNLIYIPRANTTTYGINSIKYTCAKLWNSFFDKGISINSARDMNVPFSKLKSVYHFKKVLKKHFFFIYTLE